MAKLGECSIGIALNLKCHKSTLTSKSGLFPAQDFLEAERELICLRSKVSLDSFQNICFHHKILFMHKYEGLQRSCCDPFDSHKTVVKRYLRTVSIEISKKLNFHGIICAPGQKLCSRCRLKVNNLIGVTSDSAMGCNSSESSENEDIQKEDSLEKTVILEDVNASFSGLGCSPLKLHSLPTHSKSSYGKKKIQQAKSILRKKVSTVLEEEIVLSDSSDEQKSKSELMQKATDLDNLIKLMKEKLNTTANRREKIQILTLVPPSWNKSKIRKEFDVSDYMVRQAKALCSEKGILAIPDLRQGKCLSADTMDLISNFYQDDECSRQLPGAKDRISTKTNIYMQKRLILCNLKELYIEFKNLHPNIKVGFSKFCALRPKWCVLAGASGTHTVCVCSIHQNVELLLSAAKIEESYHELIDHMVCDKSVSKCILGKCDSCPGIDPVRDILISKFSEFDPDDTIEFCQWTSTDRTELLKHNLSLQEFIDTLCYKLEKLVPHSFFAKCQSQYLKNLKNNLAQTETIVLMDFSENYSFYIQNEVQSYHWTHKSCSVHPCVIYFKEKDSKHMPSSRKFCSCLRQTFRISQFVCKFCIISVFANKIVCSRSFIDCDNVAKSLHFCHWEHMIIKSYCFISNDLDHDVSFVYKVQQELMNYIKINLGSVNHIYYFTDGCAAQYKNCKNFFNLCYHKEDFGLSASWSFFATSHGKSPCDGVGGTVKRLTRKASLQRPTENQITTAEEMYNFCKSNILNIEFNYITKDEIDQVRENLKERFVLAKTVPGTRSFHHFLPVENSKILCKNTSLDVDSSLIFDVNNQEYNIVHKLHISCYVACIYDSRWYMGLVEKLNNDEGDVLIRFLHPEGPARAFYWPKREDICHVPFGHILHVLPTPSTSSSARCYTFPLEQLKTVELAFISFQKSNL